MEILIAGGGYVAMYTARRLERLLRRGETTVTVVDPRGYMTYQPFLAEAADGSVEPRHVIAPLPPGAAAHPGALELGVGGRTAGAGGPRGGHRGAFSGGLPGGPMKPPGGLLERPGAGTAHQRHQARRQRRRRNEGISR